MCPIDDGISRLSTFSGVAALVAAADLVAWIIGLLIICGEVNPTSVQKSSTRTPTVIRLAISDETPHPEARAQHLSHAKGGITDSDGETDHKGMA
jgi:hypothetical protein